MTTKKPWGDATEALLDREVRDLAADCTVAPLCITLAAWRCFQQLDDAAQVEAIETAVEEIAHKGRPGRRT